MNFISQKTKLLDCAPASMSDSPPYRELILVEGDSASRTVARLRDPAFQAVLPMQGKPMNASKASKTAIQKNAWFAALIDALGVGWSGEKLDEVRYDRVLFLFDPDADGIHCGALMLIFFDTYLQPLLDQHRVSLIKPPLFQITAHGYHDSLELQSEEQLKQTREALASKGIRHSHRRYRGLASISDSVLMETCIDPNSRTAYLLRRDDAESARMIFGPNAPGVRSMYPGT